MVTFIDFSPLSKFNCKIIARTLLLSLGIIFVLVILSGCEIKPEGLAISSDGVEIRYDIQGEGKPTLLLIHGWSNNKGIWNAQVSHFSEKYKVISIDLPGFGESGNKRQNWSMAQYGNDVASVIKRLDVEQVVLVGFSMGGAVAIEAANTMPEVVTGIVLIDNMHNVEMKYPTSVINYIDSVYMDLVKNPTNEKLIAGGFYKKNPEASFQRVLATLKDAPTIGWRESLSDFLRWSNEDMVASIKKCQAPIIAINSDMQPTNVYAFKKLAPSFHAKIVHDVGHVIMWDAPEEFNGLLEECIQEFLN